MIALCRQGGAPDPLTPDAQWLLLEQLTTQALQSAPSHALGVAAIGITCPRLKRMLRATCDLPTA